MNEKDAYRNLMYFQTAKSESEYCENKLHVQAISQQTKWRNQHAAILSRSISTLEQHFINDKGTSTKDLPAAIAAVWKKLEEVDKRELGNTRTYKTCIKFPESLKFYEAQLVK
ncbi:MAG: hypothetical protein WA071_29515 [Undibacterium umbellatum]|uniref:hypothetical protein n=1 Tax=Undibacterium umbellatum TaxID=2762300 RepID=UPI003BB7F5D4